MSINILDSKIYNRIAAGEVIERPRSVVKELIENSIDAEAENITLEIKDGGIEFIRVTDDGCGLDGDDIKKAFLPHATSKIKFLQDLDSIMTLGFRGEALPSIASVAQIEMLSRKKDEEFGNKILYDNGELIDEGACGCPEGTLITVRHLFEKIPARKKFLAKPSVEEHEITNLVGKLILSNPNISFKYICDNEIIFISNGKGIKDSIYSVYGYDFFNNLINVENSFPDISLKGFIGKPGYSKHNRNFQSLIVNGRYVINSEISYIIQNYYSEFLMSRQFPVYVLYLTLPPDMLDVNIHPNKMEVKFADFTRVKQLLSQTIKSALNSESVHPAEMIFTKIFGDTQQSTINKNDEKKESNPINRDRVSSKKDSLEDKNSFNDNLKFKADLNNGFRDKSKLSFDESLFGSFVSLEQKTSAPKENAWENHSRQFTITNEISNSSVKVLGVLFNTYIFVEDGDNLFIIDQHAAHERYLYDKLILQYDNKKVSQQLLFPYVFETSYDEAESLKANLSELENFGFVISEVKALHFSISAIPAAISEIKFNEFIAELLKRLKSENSLKISHLMKDAIADIACKAAIKGNYSLSESEIALLIKEIGELKVLQCPHGRPIMIKFCRYEIEKWFKRKL